MLIQKYGIEGLLIADKDDFEGEVACLAILPNDNNPNQSILRVKEKGVEKTSTVRLFDHLHIEIEAQMVEFRRSINLYYRGSLNINTLTGEGVSAVEQAMDLDSAVKSSKKKKGRK